MSFKDFARKIRLVSNEINETREEQSVIIAEETVALIRLRVQNEKVNADGDSFGAYSPAYEMFRLSQNQPVDAKNFTLTGDMWRDTGITGVSTSGFTTTVTIGGQTQDAADKLFSNTERDGEILEASEDEIEFIVEAHRERILGVIDKFL